MNIAAFILALIGAGLSLFQPVIPIIGLSFSDLLSSTDPDMNTAAVLVAIIASIAVICGACTLARKGKNYCVIVLSTCAALYMFSFFMIKAPSGAEQNLPFDQKQLAFSLWMKTAFVWACCYIASAVCTFLDKSPGAYTTSAPTNTAPSATPITAQPAPKTFEPILGVETEALIKRGKIFLSDDDFAEAERYFEQALRQDPENSQAYLGKLMAELMVHNLDELSNTQSPIGEQKLFRRAVEFADDEEKLAHDEEKLALEKCLEANTAHIEAMKQKTREYLQKQQEAEALDKKYDEAAFAMQYGKDIRNTDYLKRAAELFAELGDYRDSRFLAVEAYKQYDDLQKRREKIAKTAPKIALAVGILIAALCVTVYRKPDGYLSARMGDTWSQLRVGASYHRMVSESGKYKWTYTYKYSDIERSKFHDEAVYWYEKAATKSVPAKFWLAVALTDGEGSAKKDYERALRLLGEVAQENPSSQHNYEGRYENFFYYLPNEKTEKTRNYVYDARFMLAAMYNEGLGVSAKNTKRAKEYLHEVPLRKNNVFWDYSHLLPKPPEFPATEPR